MKTEKDLKVTYNFNKSLDMVFNEDAILLSLFSVYEDENDLKAAVLKYC